MKTYITMTPSGLYGAKYSAADHDDATGHAEEDGYIVAEVIDAAPGEDVDFIVVVEDEI